MPDLSFEVESAEAVSFAAAPLLAFKLRVTNRPAGEPIHTIALQCQIMIDPARRQYTAQDQGRMLDLFGEPERWGRTVRPMLWTHTSVVVTAFTGSTVVDLPVPCTFDFNIAATKYFAGLKDGEVPLDLLFSGTIFYEAGEGALQITRIPWEKEARYRLPVQVWERMMEIYYPNSAWLCLRRDVFDKLYHYKMRRGIATWEQALESVLPDEEGPDGGEIVH
ncbi:MAG TPA: DUF6084 family protein [Blastocatellia bacterium]|nr:DUF6084 family protein [Blastocatellia bacterium]